MEFGKSEDEFGMDDETVGLGMIGAGSGKVRGEQVDARSKGKCRACILSYSAFFLAFVSSTAMGCDTC